MIAYLKRLFLQDGTELERRELAAAFVILWLVALQRLAVSVLSGITNTAFLGMKGDVDYAAMGIFNYFASQAFGVALPWNFVLLLGSLALLIRVLPRRLPLLTRFAAGYAVFVFLKTWPIALFYYLGGARAMGGPFLGETAFGSLAFFMAADLAIAAVGLVLLVVALVRARPAPKASRSGRGLDQIAFALGYFVFSLISFILVAVSIASFVLLTSADFRSLPFRILFGSITLAELVVSVWLIALRLHDAGKSPAYLLIPLGSGLFAAVGAAVLALWSSFILRYLGTALVLAGAELPMLFLLWLLIVPSKRTTAAV